MNQLASVTRNNNPSKRRSRLLTTAIILSLATAGALWSVPGIASLSPDHGFGGELIAAVHKYVCPMHPAITSDTPGDCSICGMKLVPAASGK